MSYVRAFSPFLFALGVLLVQADLAMADSPEDSAGEVVSVAGVAFIRPDGQNVSGTPLQPAKPGDRIHGGDVVNTSSNGRVKLLLKDKSIVDLGPSALFKVEGYASNSGADRQVDVSMMYGTMRTAVTQKLTGKGRFKVRTPSATMGVRGTEFVVRSELDHVDKKSFVPGAPSSGSGGAPSTASAKTEITVLQGQVDLVKQTAPSAPGRAPSAETKESQQVVSLTAGMQVSAKQADTKLEKPVILDAKQLASVASTAKVQDNTFQKAILIDVPSDGKQSSGPAPSMAGVGEATRAVLSSTLAAPAFVPVNVVNMSEFIPGATAPPPTQLPFSTHAGMRKLRVIIVND